MLISVLPAYHMHTLTSDTPSPAFLTYCGMEQSGRHLDSLNVDKYRHVNPALPTLILSIPLPQRPHICPVQSHCPHLEAIATAFPA